MESIVECVANFSEGRDAAKIEAIVGAMLAAGGAYLLDLHSDPDHHRSVVTIVGTPAGIGEAALRGIGKAAEVIDLTRHRGEHPRLGAADVVPFVPVRGVSLEDCVHIAERVAEETWKRFGIPTYLYEAAARRPDRRNLEILRRGGFEVLREEIGKDPERRPDFGEPRVHPTAGATVVGARNFLIAFNINLQTAEVTVAKAIARKIRASSGGLPGVKAMGVTLRSRRLAQVSMNLTDFETTSLRDVFDLVRAEAAARGVEIVASEIVGLVPRRALDENEARVLRIENFRPDLIFETRLERALTERQGPAS